ncbi:spore coat protein GerQ [Aciduricibacillus chroicocephali]|uniref:Spore coat protein GerQ n=1 Tax=Aciduricibacillus chroicocephali TaxID=3054939 RepID=A0ABY9KTL8_9BACI|nr:spore coat protein GerQ [Bacillaceae bacterium 44XB]
MSNYNNNQTRQQSPSFVPPFYSQGVPGQQPGAGSPQFQQQMPGGYPYTYQQPTASPFQMSPGPGMQSQPGSNVPGMLPIEQSYVENILRLNRDKLVKAYMTFENSPNQQVFQGTIEAAGRDHLILKNPETNERYLLLMVYLDYVIFPERVNYEYPFGAQTAGLLSTTAPRASGTAPTR